jgi:hypothetical protein
MLLLKLLRRCASQRAQAKNRHRGIKENFLAAVFYIEGLLLLSQIKVIFCCQKFFWQNIEFQ